MIFSSSPRISGQSNSSLDVLLRRPSPPASSRLPRSTAGHQHAADVVGPTQSLSGLLNERSGHRVGLLLHDRLRCGTRTARLTCCGPLRARLVENCCASMSIWPFVRRCCDAVRPPLRLRWLHRATGEDHRHGPGVVGRSISISPGDHQASTRAVTAAPVGPSGRRCAPARKL